MSTTPTKTRQPALFVPHGGAQASNQGDSSYHELEQWLQGFRKNHLTATPDAVLVVSAHWETSAPSISFSTPPRLPEDACGLPQNTPALAQKVHTALGQHKLPVSLVERRGTDHGVSIPLKLMFPDGDVPVLQMSILSSLDPEQHIQLGEALRSIRNENMLVVGSGMSFHNFKYFFKNTIEGHVVSEKFHEYLTDALVNTTDPAMRREKLVKWVSAPYARECHPREDHLLPLLVVAGASLDEPCHEVFAGKIFGVRCAAYLFGATRAV